MQKDVKTGMALGLLLVTAAALWLATRPSLSTKARMPDRHKAVPLHARSAVLPPQNPDSSDTALTQEPANAQNNQSSIINHQSPIINRQSKVRFHIIKKGESLSGISQTYYGSAGKWQKILNANRRTIKDANRLTPGTQIIIPE